MRTVLKVLLVLLVIILLLLGGFFLFLHFAFNGIFTGPSYDKQDLIENYENKTSEINDLKNYYKTILPEDKYVDIEFKNDEELAIFHVKIDSIYQSNWNLKIDSPKVDSLLTALNWTNKELMILKEKLDNANCISIANSEPIVIGWQRSDMGIFSYVIFEQDLDKKKIKEYNDGCTYIFYKNNIVLKYEGGAIGIQCFPEYYREKDKVN